MAAGFNSPQILFLNTWDAPERDYLFPIFQKLLGQGYRRFIEPCSGAFVMPSVAVEAGWQTQRMEMSDVSLFSSLLGYTFMEKRLDELDIRLDGEPYEFEREPDGRPKPVSHDAAEALYLQLKLRMDRRPDLPYWNELRADINDRRDEHVADIERYLLKLDARMHGCRYRPLDVWEHLREVAEDPETVISINPPTYKCLEVNERILTADLRWVPAGDILEGEQVLAFDEESSPEKRRHWRRAVVTRSERGEAECVRVTLEDGTSVICTVDHPWLASHGQGSPRRWVEARHLLDVARPSKPVTTFVYRGFETWEPSDSYVGGWLAGMFDGEGSLTLKPDPCAAKLVLSQVRGRVADRLETYLTACGVTFGKRDLSPEPPGKQEMVGFDVLGGFREIAETLGRLRPVRLLDKFRENFDSRGVRSKPVAVVGVEPVGKQWIQSITTSTQTYVGEGFLMHNSGFEKFFDTGGRLTWATPKYEIFDASVDVFRLMEFMADKPALILCQQQQVPGNSADYPVFARFLSAGKGQEAGQYVYIVTNKPEKVLELAGGLKVQPMKATEVKPLPYPVIPVDYEITESSKVEFAVIGQKEAGWYRDLWMHKLDFRGAGAYVAVVVDGYLAGLAGYDPSPILRPYSEDSKWAGCLLLTFAVGAPHKTRLTRLVTMASLQEDVIKSALNAQLYALVQAVITVELTKHPEAKGLRGIMKLKDRRKDPKYGNRLIYWTEIDTRAMQLVVQSFVQKEQQWLKSRKKAAADAVEKIVGPLKPETLATPAVEAEASGNTVSV